jgi:hypothetical protein
MGRYHVHEVEVAMTEDREKAENFLNSLEGEVTSIIPNVHRIWGTGYVGVDFLWVVEKEKAESG